MYAWGRGDMREVNWTTINTRAREMCGLCGVLSPACTGAQCSLSSGSGDCACHHCRSRRHCHGSSFVGTKDLLLVGVRGFFFLFLFVL